MLSKIIGVIFVCLFLFFGLKSCILTTWESHKNPATYSIRGADGREFTIIFLPEFETMIWYVDPSRNFIEGVLTKMRGSYGTHYLGPIWRVEGPRAGGLFGFRRLPTGQEPIHMEIINLDKYTQGRGESTFGKIGETFYAVILKEKDRIQFQGMWLELVNMEPTMIAELRAKFKKAQ
jgi:hypothetical protein